MIGAIAGGGKGAAIGAATGAGAGAVGQTVTKGKSVKVPSESLLTFRLDRSLRLGSARYRLRTERATSSPSAVTFTRLGFAERCEDNAPLVFGGKVRVQRRARFEIARLAHEGCYRHRFRILRSRVALRLSKKSSSTKTKCRIRWMIRRTCTRKRSFPLRACDIALLTGDGGEEAGVRIPTKRNGNSCRVFAVSPAFTRDP